MKKPHVILGVKEHPTLSEVRAAYKQLSLKYHPDLHPGEEEIYVLMSEINAAYDYFKKLLSHDDKNDASSTTSTGSTNEEPRRHWNDYTKEEKQRIWEEMQARWEFQRKEAYKESGRNMRNKIARNLEPIRDVNKKFLSDIKGCSTFAELEKTAIDYAMRIEEMIVTMYEYAEKNHRYGMPPESFYHTEIFEKNVNKNFPLERVKSSQILAIGFDEDNQYLYVQFNSGSIYVYYGVVKYVYDGFKKAKSIGKYFGAYIRNKYKYTRLT